MFKILSNTFKTHVPLPNIHTYQVPRPSPGTFAERPVDSHDLIALHDKHTISLRGNIRNMWGNDLRQSGVLVALRGVTGASRMFFFFYFECEDLLITIITSTIEY